MPTIQERLLQLGARLGEKFCGRAIQSQRTGLWLTGEFEEVEPLMLDTELGEDPREGSWFHFLRPLPDIRPADRLLDAAGNQWDVLTGFENHPYKPRARVKVKLFIAGTDS